MTAPEKASALAELERLINEYDPLMSDWTARKNVMLGLIGDLRFSQSDRAAEMRENLLDIRQDMSAAEFAPHEKSALGCPAFADFKPGNPYHDGWRNAFREAERCLDEAIRALSLEDAE